MRSKALFFSIILILIGFLLTFFLGYKESSFLGIISYLAFFFGWLVLVFSIFGKHYSFSKPKFNANKSLWFQQTFKNLGIISLCVIGIFTSIFITGNITEKRIQKILYTYPTEETIAEVIYLESRYTRGGWKVWAIFSYKTSKNETYQKGVFNYKNKYKKGDKYYILYSIKYPEIIELEDKLD